MSKWTNRDRQYSSGHFNLEETIQEREARERDIKRRNDKTIRYVGVGTRSINNAAMAAGLIAAFSDKNTTKLS